MLPLNSGDLFANRFEIDRIAGTGGMSTVYRARDQLSGETVALKLLQARGADPNEAERFIREAQILAALNHSGIVSYIVHGVTPEGHRYLAMEWLDGEDLAQRLTRGPLSLSDSILILRRAAEALALAHGRGIIHRDLKPSNLFLPDGDPSRLKLLDFGVARQLTTPKAITYTGLVIGTPEYMAPEQARGERRLTPAADIFSLGCVLYECLAGEAPFAAAHVAAALIRILFEDPVPIEQRRLGIPPLISDMLNRMLAKDPSKRFADASALLAVIDELGETIELTRAPTLPAPQLSHSHFAESEQGLFSLIVASVAHEVTVEGETMRPQDAPDQDAGLAALLSALQMLGVQAEYLLGGSLIATVQQMGSATDQVGLAAQVALLIKERWPTAEVAIATGRGMAQGMATLGEVADRAAHLMQLATGEQRPEAGEARSGVWLDELSARLLGTRFAVIKAANGTHLVGEHKEVDATRPLLGKPTPCLGRDAELAALEGQLAGCIQESDARAALITAPPGAGKSRLLHEFLRRIEKNGEPTTLLLGRGEVMSAGSPYRCLGQAIRRLCGLSGSEHLAEQRCRLRQRIGHRVAAADADRVVGFIGELSGASFPDEEMPTLRSARLNPKLMSDGIRRAFLDWLSAECQAAAVLLVVDDLQWGDVLTASLIDEALRELKGASLFVLALARPEIHEIFPRLWQRHKIQEIQLKGLSKRACERLIQQVLGQQVTPELTARAIELSNGNALFLEELIRSIAERPSDELERVPETVVAMLQARISRFETGPRRAVRAAAIFGQTFWTGGVTALLGIPGSTPITTSWLSALVDAEVIERHPDSRLAQETEYGFRHALVRDAAYSLLTQSDLITGHSLAGKFLDEAGERDAAVIAEHYERGGQLARAIPLYKLAGDNAGRLGSYLDAREYYGKACTLLEQLPVSSDTRRLKTDLLLRQVQTSLVATAQEQNLERLAEARWTVESLLASGEAISDDRLRLARTDYLHGQVLYYSGQPAGAIAYYKRVLPVAIELGDRELQVVPSYVSGMALYMQGQAEKARELLANAAEPLHEAGMTHDWLRARLFHAMALAATGAYTQGSAEIISLLDHAHRLNQPMPLSLAYSIYCGIPWVGWDWPTVLERSKKAIEAAQQAGDQVYIYMVLGLRAWAESFLGMTEQAEQSRAARTQLAQSLGGRMLAADWFAASDCEILLNAGRHQEALGHAESLISTSLPAGLVLSHGIAERVCGIALARLGSDEAASSERFRNSIEVFESAGLVLQAAHTRLAWARVLLAQNEPTRATEQFSLAVARLDASGCTYALAQARSISAMSPE